MARKTKLYPIDGGEAYMVTVERAASGHRASSEAPDFDAHVATQGPGRMSVVTEKGSYEVSVERRNGEIAVKIENEWFRFNEERESADIAPRSRARAEVKAPMPGKVVQLLANVGEKVVAGQGILLFEAMKMQNEIRSPQDGVLSSMAVAVGQTIDARERLFVIKGNDS